ncbi:MAG: methanogenesis marker 8 protein [Candidatus Bathycorpusculaceae bacterium]
MRIKGVHEIYCCGARVRISEKGIEVLSEPLIEYCPLHEALYGTKNIDVETVRKTVEMKIANFGFCCENRLFDSESVVAYGASEMMRIWLEKKLVDCAVVVCEGAGTVITTNGKLVQGIGARLTGIIKTSPIKEIIKHIEDNGGTILDKATAKIDQVEGVRKAFKLGFKQIAVSIAGFQAQTISEIRNFEAKTKADTLIFSVCNTCVKNENAKHIAKADIACASASEIIRTEIGSKALLQLGVTIPVYVLTEKGKTLVLAYLNEFKDKLVIFRTSKLPYQTESRAPRLKKS